jgi:hypothetical protein
MAVKRVNVLLNSMIADIEEKDDYVIIKNPAVFQVLPDAKGQLKPALLPLDATNPLTELKVPKDHVYAIESLDPEIIKLYEQIITEVRLIQSGIQTNTSGPRDSLNLGDKLEIGKIKKFNKPN